MHIIWRRTRSVVSCTAAGTLVLAAVVVPASAQAVEPTHTIAQVQGTAAATPIPGSTVTVEAAVTANHQASGFRGVYVQSAGSGGTVDTTPGASDGIFVYLGSSVAAAGVGDVVRVTGVVAEYGDSRRST